MSADAHVPRRRIGGGWMGGWGGGFKRGRRQYAICMLVKWCVYAARQSIMMAWRGLYIGRCRSAFAVPTAEYPQLVSAASAISQRPDDRLDPEAGCLSDKPVDSDADASRAASEILLATSQAHAHQSAAHWITINSFVLSRVSVGLCAFVQKKTCVYFC